MWISLLHIEIYIFNLLHPKNEPLKPSQFLIDGRLKIPNYKVLCSITFSGTSISKILSLKNVYQSMTFPIRIRIFKYFLSVFEKIAKITSAKITKWFFEYPIVTQKNAKINQKYECTWHKNLYVSFSAI